MSFESYRDFLADPFGGNGYLLTDEPDMRVWIRDRGDGVIEQCVVSNSDPILEDAARARSDNLNKRWGDGQVIGHVPLDLYFSSGLSEANAERDKKWIAKFWNDIDYSRLRTFEGRI